METRLFSYTANGVLSIWNKIPKNAKFTFLCTVIAGLAAHLTFMTGTLFNNDSFLCIYLPNGVNYIYMGRWFSNVVYPFFLGKHVVPFVAGLISVILIAFIAAVTVITLKLKNYISCLLIGLLLATFPSAAAVLFCVWLAPNFFCALLFAALGVYFTVRFKYGFFGGSLFAFSLGIYQAYICYAIGIYALYFIFELLENKNTPKKTWSLISKMFIALALGFTLYLIITKATLHATNTGMTTYQSLNTMGHIKPRTGIKNAFNAFINFFFKGNPGFGTDTILIKLLTLISAFMMCIIIVKRKICRRNNIFNFILLLFLGLTLPITLNTIYVFSSSGDVSVGPIMIYSYILYPVFFVGLTEKFGDTMAMGTGANISMITCYITASLIFAVGWKYFSATNLLYMRSELNQRQAVNYIGGLIENITSTEGYVPGAKIIGYGTLPAGLTENALHDEIEVRDTSPSAAKYLYHPNYWIGSTRYLLGLEMPPITFISEEDAVAYPELGEMPTYPQDGSIRITDSGDVIIKFGA